MCAVIMEISFLMCEMLLCVCAKSLQSCLTLCNPMDCSPPGSSVHGILQARILEWVAIPSSTGSSQLRDQTLARTGMEGRLGGLHWLKSLLNVGAVTSQ